MLLVYTPKITNRIKYIFHHIFKCHIGLAVKFTSAIEEFIAHSGPKISYGKKPLGNELHFGSHGLLTQIGVDDIDVVMSEWKGMPVFFKTGVNSVLPFDIFAGSFYLITRYEEYLPHTRDEHDRYNSLESLAVVNKFSKVPLIDVWIIELVKVLKSNFDIEITERKFKYISSINISSAYRYRLKGLVRGFIGMFVDLFKFKLKFVYERVFTVLKLVKDPYDSISFLNRLQNKLDLKMSYFFLVSDYTKYDRNVSYHKVEFRTLIKSIGDTSEIGLMPSYFSNSESKKLSIEKKRLEEIVKYKVENSRQYYSKLVFPETYRSLIDNEIYNDFSMGYTDNIGFRASTSESFYFYDLDYEVRTPLLVHPYIVNDRVMKDNLNMIPADAVDEILRMMSYIKSINGQFISVFHNESLGKDVDWAGWRNVYIDMVKASKEEV
ncbi:MAG: polysaccharide deacetylase family protein [Ichthyobacteriaceae bacterium]|nr:polysaccharide deacetylase family protein [Ichthyobacteriaceae bacterium]